MRRPPPIGAHDLRAEVADLRGSVESMLEKGGTADELAAIRDRLAALEPRLAGAGGGGSLMEIILLGIYSFFVWLIFFKFKWLPWNTTSQVTVVVIPIVGLTALILLLNIFAPSSHDVRVFKYTVPDRLAGARPRDRGADRGGQPAGPRGRRAVQGRSDALSAHRQQPQGAAGRRRGRGRHAA